jgi:hypothetical protein
VNITYEELARFGQAIDTACDAGDPALLEALDVQGALYCEDDDTEYIAYLWYFRSNIHSALQDIADRRSWEWRQPRRERQILYPSTQLNALAEDSPGLK